MVRRPQESVTWTQWAPYDSMSSAWQASSAGSKQPVAAETERVAEQADSVR